MNLEDRKVTTQLRRGVVASVRLVAMSRLEARLT